LALIPGIGYWSPEQFSYRTSASNYPVLRLEGGNLSVGSNRVYQPEVLLRSEPVILNLDYFISPLLSTVVLSSVFIDPNGRVFIRPTPEEIRLDRVRSDIISILA